MGAFYVGVDEDAEVGGVCLLGVLECVRGVWVRGWFFFWLDWWGEMGWR